jgi:RNA polymerase sigma factor (TIGR02999 family)
VNGGDASARDRLWSLIYDELRGIAQHQMAAESPGRTLQPTALVHEAFMRLMGDDSSQWTNRRHFFAAAAEAMRRIRVDDARKRKRLKRGGGRAAEPIREEPPVFDQDPAEVLAIGEALDELEQTAPRKAQVVKLRYFAGLSVDDCAGALDVSPRTVDKDWAFARAWLHRRLSGDSDDTTDGAG